MIHEHIASLFVRCEHCLMFGTPVGEPFQAIQCGNCGETTARWYVPEYCVKQYENNPRHNP